MPTTYGWDSAFVMRMDNLNAAIASKKSSPAGFQRTDPDGSAIDGVFGDWKATGGSGEILEMTLPITSVDVTPAGQAKVAAGAASVTIEVELQLLPQPGATATSGPNVFKVNPDTVQMTGTTWTPPQGNFDVSTTFDALFGEWLLANIGDFDHAFAVVDLAKELSAEPGHQFLVPTFTRYAVGTDSATGDATFAVLSMTGNRGGQGRTQAVDDQALPAGSNAAYLMSPALLLSEFLKPGLSTLFKDLDQTRLALAGSGTQLTNLDALTFQTFKLSDDTTRDASIPAMGFKAEVIGDKLALTFDGVSFKWSPDIDVRLRCVSTSTLGYDTTARKITLTTETLTPDAVVSSGTTTLILTTVAAVLVELIVAVIGSAIGSRFKDPVNATDAIQMDDAGTSANLNPGPQSIPSGSDPGSPAPNISGQRQAATDLTESTQTLSGWWGRLSPKVKGGMLGVLVGSIISSLTGNIANFIEADAENKLGDIPTIDTFVTNATNTTLSWPDGTVFTPSNLVLADCLQIAGIVA